MTPREGRPVAWIVRDAANRLCGGPYLDRGVADTFESRTPWSKEGPFTVVPLFDHPATPADGAPFTYAVVNSLGDVVAGSKIEGGAKYKAKLVQRAEDVGETSADGPYRVVPLYAHPAATAREEVWKAMVEALEQVVPDWLPESASEAAPVVKECYVDIAIRLVRARRALALARSTGAES